ncbi:MAG: monosaccharide transporter substrate-binding protein family [Actinomycetia bacterium]|nr:monosaccharide transporter substrate-binding protein family [Actinomycetes bacterium]
MSYLTKKRTGENMSRTLRLSAAALAVIALGSITVAATAAPDKKAATYNVAFVSSISNTFTAAIYNGFKDAAKGKPVKVTMFDVGVDPQKEYSTIQDIVAQKQYQGIAMLPLDPVSVIPAVKAAIKAGVKVVTFNNPLGPDLNTLRPQVPGQTAVVMDATQFQRGIWMGQMAVDACKGINPCQVSYMQGLAGIAGETALRNGFRKGIAGHSSVKYVGNRAAGGYTPQQGQTATQDLLQAIPGLNVLASSDQIVRGAYLASQSAGKTKQLKLIGLGGSSSGVAATRSGQWYGTVVTLPYDIGVQSLNVLVRGIKTGVKGLAINVTTATGTNPKLTKKNAASFKPQWTG